MLSWIYKKAKKCSTSIQASLTLLQLKAVSYNSGNTEFGVMKIVAALIILLVCIKAITAAPAVCSDCSTEPVASTGPCSYCLATPNTTRELYMDSLDDTNLNYFIYLHKNMGKVRMQVVN